MPIDGDATVGPTVTLDSGGNILLSYTSISIPGDGSVVLVTAGGVQYLIPPSQIIGGNPGVQTSAGTLNIMHAYGRSQGWI